MTRGSHPWFKKITTREAEAIMGRRLDRRVQYYRHTLRGAFEAANGNTFAGFGWGGGSAPGRLFTYGEWTESCSGCSCDCGDGYGCSHGAAGCQECGFTGKRRSGMHAPFDPDFDPANP